jgi:hypothetical protein
MLSLILATVIVAPAPAPVAGPQAVQATLQSCAMEGGRWVCRYAVPDIEIVPLPGNDVVADAPAAILGVRPAEAPAASEVAPPADTVPATAAPERRAITLDAGILTEREQRLVARCADAPWYAVCLPDDRRAARVLKDKEEAFLTVRATVTARLAAQDCDGAVKAALDGGYLELAGQAQGFCSASTSAAN